MLKKAIRALQSAESSGATRRVIEAHVDAIYQAASGQKPAMAMATARPPTRRGCR